MVEGRKRSRCSNWSHEETLLLAELKWKAFLNKEEGGLMWEQIAQTISSRFPNQIRSHDHCRRRWDTLRKDYNHIEEYCIETGQDHWELDEDELSSMKLDTAYRQDWYNIVKQVCSQHKRKEREGCDLIVVKRSKTSNTGSHSSVLPECKPVIDALITMNSPGRNTLCRTPSALISEHVITTWETHHEQSTTSNARFSTRPSVDFEGLRPEEENQRLKRELAQFWQCEQVTQHDQVLQPFSSEVRSMVKEPSLQDAVLDCPDAVLGCPDTMVVQPFPAEIRSEVKEPLQDVVLGWSDVRVPQMLPAKFRSEVKEPLEEVVLDYSDATVLQPFPAEVRCDVKESLLPEIRFEVEEPLQDDVLDCPDAIVLQPFPAEVRSEVKESVQDVVLDCPDAIVLQPFPAEVRSEVKESVQDVVLDWSDVTIPEEYLAALRCEVKEPLQEDGLNRFDATVLQPFPTEVRPEVKEPIQDVVLDWNDVTVPQEYLAALRCEVKEPLQGVLLDWHDVSVELSSKVEQDDTDLELRAPSSTSLHTKCFKNGEGLEAMNSAGCNGVDLFVTFTCFSPPLSFTAWEYHEYHLSGTSASNFSSTHSQRRTGRVWVYYKGKRQQIRSCGIRPPRGRVKGYRVTLRPPNSRAKIRVGTFATRTKAERAFDAVVHLIGKEPYSYIYSGNYFRRRPPMSNFQKLQAIVQKLKAIVLTEAKKYAEKNGPLQVNPSSLILNTSTCADLPESFDVLPEI